MRHIVPALAVGGVLFGLVALLHVPAYADDDVAALVVDNGSAKVPEPATWALFATGLTGLAVLGLRRRRKSSDKPDQDKV